MYIYLYLFHKCIYILVKWIVFNNGPGDQGSIPGQVISTTQKWYLTPQYLIFSTIRLVSRIKWSNPGKRVALSRVVNVKGAFWSPSTTVANFICVNKFANGPGDWGSIQGQVIPKTQKLVLDAALLNTQHYKIRIKCKVEQSREWSSAMIYKENMPILNVHEKYIIEMCMYTYV